MSEWVMRLTDVQKLATELERVLHACGHHEAADICVHKFSDIQTIFSATFSDKKMARPFSLSGIPTDVTSLPAKRGQE